MDCQINAAARRLTHGDPLGALESVALREDPPALALRGTALAQLGDLSGAAALLRRAGQGFTAAEPLNRARCTLARAEVALAQRDFSFPDQELGAAAAVLARHGDRFNGSLATLLMARRQLLLGKVGGAERTLASLGIAGLPSALAGLGRLLEAQLAIRRIAARRAAELLALAAAEARKTGIGALQREIEQAQSVLRAPAGRVLSPAGERELTLHEVERLLALPGLLVDACRRQLTCEHQAVDLSKRPVPFALVELLASERTLEATRERLVHHAFSSNVCNDSHRARLRVEVGRLRSLLGGMARICATPRGFRLVPRDAMPVRVLLPPLATPHAALLALLSDGQGWSTSGVALALGKSQRSVQRACNALRHAGAVIAVGQGPSRRWLSASLAPIAPAMLLPLAGGEL